MAFQNFSRTDLLAAYSDCGDTRATIYVPSPSATEDAEQRLTIRRKNVLSQLGDLGVSHEIAEHASVALDGIDHAEGAAHLLVVGEKGVDISMAMNRPLSRAFTALGPCPALLPLLEATQADAEHLAILVDRTGADVLHRVNVGDPIDEVEVDGPDVRVHRSHPGGWSQKRFQQTAENAWENNAREVVDQITDEFPEIELVVCGGDVRAVGFFTDHLPERYEAHVVEGSRHADQDAFLDDVDTALRTRTANTQVELLDQWRSALANDAGSTGLDVLKDLSQGRVDHLLVVNDATDEHRESAAFNFDEGFNALDGNSGDGQSAPVTDGAVALAVATGAKVTVIPSIGDVQHGLAAILRF